MQSQMKTSLNTAQVVRLPRSAESKVVQTRGAGRLPNSIVRLHVVRYERRKLDLDADLIQREIESRERLVACIEEMLADVRHKLQKLRQVQPGTPEATQLREYVTWIGLSSQDRARFQSVEWPL